MRDGQFFNMESTMPIESSETGDSGKVEVHVLDAVISRSIQRRTESRSWLAIS